MLIGSWQFEFNNEMTIVNPEEMMVIAIGVDVLSGLLKFRDIIEQLHCFASILY